ncbi:MAG: extracellular solute-binding protein [Clostridia bacterium]|nr:extracellular solute-binding protein [Clostridia bacterium]
MMKKVISLILAILVVVSAAVCLSSCGEKTTTIKWATSWSGQEDDAAILKVVNKKLEEALPGIQIEFVEFNAQKWTQQMAAGEVIDLAWAGFSINMDAEITNGSYMALNDLINEKDTPNIWKEWKEEYPEDYESGTVNGKLYAVPNQQPLISETPFLKIPASLMEYFDVDAFLKATYASPKTTRAVYEVLDKYFKKIFEINAVDTDLVSKSVDIQNLYTYLVSRGYTAIDKNSQLYYDTFSDDVKLVNIAETEEYKLFMEYAVKWYKEGYIAKNVLVSGGASGSRLSPLTAHINGMWYELDDPARGIRKVYDTEGELEQYYLNIEPADYSHKALGPSILGSESTYYTIPYTSKNPEKAIKFLDFLRSPVGTPGNEILNLLVYGFEKNSAEAKELGRYHYTLDGDLAIGNGYTLQPDSSAPYGKPHWAIGNVFLTYRTPNILEGQGEYAKKYESETIKTFKKTPLYRFRADTSSLSVEIGNITSAYTEYHDRLICGVDGDNYMNTYNAYMKKLNDGGMAKIKEELQKQADKYMAENKF